MLRMMLLVTEANKCLLHEACETAKLCTAQLAALVNKPSFSEKKTSPVVIVLTSEVRSHLGSWKPRNQLEIQYPKPHRTPAKDLPDQTRWSWAWHLEKVTQGFKVVWHRVLQVTSPYNVPIFSNNLSKVPSFAQSCAPLQGHKDGAACTSASALVICNIQVGSQVPSFFKFLLVFHVCACLSEKMFETSSNHKAVLFQSCWFDTFWA